MRTLVAILITGAAWPVLASTSNPSRDAVVAFYTSKGSAPQIEQTKRAVEVCFDVCEFYQFGSAVDQVAAWDVVFLHQYYYVTLETYGLEDFREEYSSHAASLLVKYANLCPRVPSDQRPKCILGKLGSKNQVRGASVRYDEGYRCEVESRLTDPRFQGRSTCRKVKHAS